MVGASDSLVLFHLFDWDCFCLNGYTVIREKDISHHRVFDKKEFWQHRAVRHFGLKPICPHGLSITSFPELLASVAKRYPMITVRREVKRPGAFFVGQLVTARERTFTIDGLSCNAEWTGKLRIRFQELTRVDFGGGYETALAATAPKMPAKGR